MCGHQFQQTGHQPGMVANPASGQLNRENGIFVVKADERVHHPEQNRGNGIFDRAWLVALYYL